MYQQHLSPYAFGDLEDLMAYLLREEDASDEDLPRIIGAGNRAVGWMERETLRALAARVYRAEGSISCTLSTDSTAVTGSGFTAGVKELDDIVGSGLQPGTRVAEVTSDTALVLTKRATGGGAASPTVGSEPLLVDGEESGRIWLPEFPVIEVYSVKWIDSDGTKTSLDLTGARLDKKSGEYLIPNDAVPAGHKNIEVEYAAGYRQPSSTSRGNFNEWEALQGIWHQVARVYFKDWAEGVSRETTVTLANMQTSKQSLRMPENVMEAIAPYRRVPLE